MRALTEHDLLLIRRKLPKFLAEELKSGSAYIAGGFIRAVIAHEEPSDIDLFVRDRDTAEALATRLEEDNGELYRVVTDNAITLYDHGRLGRIPIQIITRWFYSDPHELVMEFDFTICQAAVWYVPAMGEGSLAMKAYWNSVASDGFYPDLAAKRLTYTAPARNEDAGGSILRVLKYYRRGYTIPLTDMGLVIARLMKGVDFNKVAPTNEPALGLVIRGLLREVDPLIDPDHIIQESAQEAA